MAENTAEFYVDEAGEHRWRIQAANGRIVASSGEGYHNQADAAKGLYAVLTKTDLEMVAKVAKKL